MDASIRRLYDQKLITARVALDKAIDKAGFKDLPDAPERAPAQA